MSQYSNDYNSPRRGDVGDPSILMGLYAFGLVTAALTVGVAIAPVVLVSEGARCLMKAVKSN